MKLPNGYGSVYKLPGRRRRPWAVRITLSHWTEADGRTHWKYKYLGYYETRSLALCALACFHENTPYCIDASPTFAELFDAWSAERFPKISASNIRGYLAAYALCASLSDMPVLEIRKMHLQRVIDTCGKNYPTLKKLKVLFSALFRYAMENDICNKNYALYVDINSYRYRNPNALTRRIFSDFELQLLWERCKESQYTAIVLMLIYSGCRIGELLSLKKENVNLPEQWFDIISAKTDAGIRRVPIADKVLPLFSFWMENSSCDYLLATREGIPFTYQNYYANYWKPHIARLLPTVHYPHDTRHTCVSLLVAAGVGDKLIKKIVGHKGRSVTENTYTHFHFRQLLDAVNKL